MTDTMRVITQDGFGGPEVLRLERRAVPRPAPTEILVQVHAASINPVDLKTRQASLFAGDQPITLGWDVSGVVTAVGAGVRHFTVGDEVFGMPKFPHEAGGYGEYLTGPARHFAAKPANIDHVTAAALPLAGLTAWQAIVDVGRVTAGQRILVHAAGGGVGHLAVQMAKQRGAHVIGTASAGKRDFVLSLGADDVIDYHATDFTTVLKDLDMVIDPICGEYGPRSASVLRDGGVLITLADNEPLITVADRRRISSGFMLVEPDRVGLEGIAALVESGALRVEVSRTFPLEQAAAAHRYVEAGHTTGKVVLTVADESEVDAGES
jgi:NADPH:quinone reductase-like Zn-dependent oxidoreductase